MLSTYQSPSQRARMLRESKLAQNHRAHVKQKLSEFTDLPAAYVNSMHKNRRLNPAGRKVRPSSHSGHLEALGLAIASPSLRGTGFVRSCFR